MKKTQLKITRQVTQSKPAFFAAGDWEGMILVLHDGQTNIFWNAMPKINGGSNTTVGSLTLNSLLHLGHWFDITDA